MKNAKQRMKEEGLTRADDFDDWYRYGTGSQKDFFWLINDKFKEGDIRYARKLFAKLSPNQKRSFTEIKAFEDAAKVLSERMAESSMATGGVIDKLNNVYSFKELFK